MKNYGSILSEMELLDARIKIGPKPDLTDGKSKKRL
jgi:hypothetical protein